MNSTINGSGAAMESTGLEITIDGKHISLSGDLVGTLDQAKQLKEFFSLVPKGQHTYEIDADNVRLSPEGVTAWINAVSDRLSECVLIYRSSQLSEVLQYDPRYTRESTFLEANESKAPPFSPRPPRF
jgi:hypothetical protein